MTEIVYNEFLQFFIDLYQYFLKIYNNQQLTV